MGQFLAIGLRLTAAIRKKDIEKQSDDKSADDILKLVEEKYNLTEIYDRKEDGEYYVYHLKNEFLDNELVPFIEKFYALRYSNGAEMDEADALNDIKSHPDTSARLVLLERKRYQAYQVGDEVDYFYPYILRSSEISVYSHNAILSIDGKIIMECYGHLFDFFRRCIVAQMTEFELAKALTVWIEGWWIAMKMFVSTIITLASWLFT